VAQVRGVVVVVYFHFYTPGIFAQVVTWRLSYVNGRCAYTNFVAEAR
jgi:hypothetical protein